MKSLQLVNSGEYPADACLIGQGTTYDTCNDPLQPRAICPSAGALGTPVIDTTSNSLYVVAESQDQDTNPQGINCVNKQGLRPNFYHRLHALNLATLAEQANSPQLIPSQQVGQQTFASLQEIQRPGLLFFNNTVYIAFSMMDGTRPRPSGWIFSFNAQNLATPPAFFATVPGIVGGGTVHGGGIWQGGGGLVVGSDGTGNFLYFSTADGTFDFSSGGPDLADSFVKLKLDLSRVADYFTPSDAAWRDCINPMTGKLNDLDFASGGAMAIPDGTVPNHLYTTVKLDKEGGVWVIDRANPGGFNGGSCGTGCAQQCTNPNNNTQTIMTGGYFHNNPAYWNGNVYAAGSTHDGPLLPMTKYVLCPNSSPVLCPPPNLIGSTFQFTYGATPSVSSDPNNNNGIVWAINSDGSTQNGNPAVLYALDAQGLTELYDSNQCGTADQPGPATKYSVPTIANGYVFIGTQTDFDIYGVLPTIRQCQ